MLQLDAITIVKDLKLQKLTTTMFTEFTSRLFSFIHFPQKGGKPVQLYELSS